MMRFFHEYKPVFQDILFLFIVGFVLFCLMVGVAMGISVLGSNRFELEAACWHHQDRNMTIFVNGCMEQGYTFGQCYYIYVDAERHGGDFLSMPSTWA